MLNRCAFSGTIISLMVPLITHRCVVIISIIPAISAACVVQSRIRVWTFIWCIASIRGTKTAGLSHSDSGGMKYRLSSFNCLESSAIPSNLSARVCRSTSGNTLFVQMSRSSCRSITDILLTCIKTSFFDYLLYFPW